MKRKAIATLLAIVTTTAMMGTTVFAAEVSPMSQAGVGQDVEGTTTVENPVYNVVIPTNMTVSIDPFEEAGDSQIVSGDLTLINKSSIPVQMYADMYVVPGEGVTLVASKSDVSQNPSSKDVYVELVASKEVTVDETDGDDLLGTGGALEGLTRGNTKTSNFYKDAATATAVAGDTLKTPADATLAQQVAAAKAGDYDAAAPSIAFDPVLGASMTFALENGTYVNAYKTADAKEKVYISAGTTNPAAGFKLNGVVTEKANWKDTDIKVYATYTFFGMNTTDFGAVTPLDSTKGGPSLLAFAKAPKFTSTTIGAVAVDAGAGAWEIDEITSFTIDNYDILKADEFQKGCAITKNVTTGAIEKITIDAATNAWYKEDKVATINYKTATGASKTATVTVKFTS